MYAHPNPAQGQTCRDPQRHCVWGSRGYEVLLALLAGVVTLLAPTTVVVAIPILRTAALLGHLRGLPLPHGGHRDGLIVTVRTTRVTRTGTVRTVRTVRTIFLVAIAAIPFFPPEARQRASLCRCGRERVWSRLHPHHSMRTRPASHQVPHLVWGWPYLRPSDSPPNTTPSGRQANSPQLLVESPSCSSRPAVSPQNPRSM